MISEEVRIYDRNVIIPRETIQRNKLQQEHDDLWRTVHEVAADAKEALKTIHQWSWPIKIILGMLSLILLGVAAQVADLVKWGIQNGWKY